MLIFFFLLVLFKPSIYILETIKNATVIYAVFLIDCVTARIVFVSNYISFARERLSKHWAQLHTPVENCVEKWQNHHICHLDLLSPESLPNFVINVLILSIAIRKKKRNKNNPLAGKT